VCFGLSAVAFVAGWILAAIAAEDIEGFFYQPRVLAVTHTFTLGWISLTMIGVLYQYVPSLTKRPIVPARAAGLQVACFALGTHGMVTHFWIGHLSGMAWSAGLVLFSVLLLNALLLPSLLRAPRCDATVIGIVAALIYFLGTAILGMLYAIDKVHPFLGGNVLANIAGHAHLGLVGWITLTICAVSYRMVAAFLLPEVLLPTAARRQIVLLTCLTPLLLVTLLLRSPLSVVVALLVVLALGWYACIMWQLLRTRRMPLDWSLAHVIAAVVHLAAAVGCALALAVAVDPGSVFGSRLVVAYGVLALIGWISNFIIGMGSRMASGLAGKGPKPILSDSGRRAAFGLLNGGILAVVGAALGGQVLMLQLATLLPLSAALLFAGALVRRLAW
jgi:hypothetical protein